MLSKLMQENSAQESIIEMQAGIIDELFVLVCQHYNYEELEGITPLLTSMLDVQERKEQLL